MTPERLEDELHYLDSQIAAGCHGVTIGANYAKKLSDLCRRLSAEASELRRERDEARAARDGWLKAAQDNLDLAKKYEDFQRAAEAALSDARGKALEEAAQLCEAIRDARFSDLPDHENEPDFSADDATAEDACAWHIRAAKARALTTQEQKP